MRYTPVILLFCATLILGGCLTLETPTVANNTVSAQNVGRRGFSFPLPPGYQASTPEEFESLAHAEASAGSQMVMNMITEARQTYNSSGKTLFIYRPDELIAGNFRTIIIFTYSLHNVPEPLDKHTAIRDMVMARSRNNTTARLSEVRKITSSSTFELNGRPWNRITGVDSERIDGKTYQSYMCTLLTAGDLNDVYTFIGFTYEPDGGDLEQVMDNMANQMKL
ncbi:MAG: hypothetical protein ACQKBW_10250 [Puniceicoccales bacterium]